MAAKKRVHSRNKTIRAPRRTATSTSSSRSRRPSRETSDNGDGLSSTQEEHAFLLSSSRKKKWVRPKGFGRGADGTGPGRVKGTENKATKEIKEAIQLRGAWLVTRLFELASSRDLQVAHAACKTLILYGYGRPTLHVSVDGTTKKHYVVELPKPLSHDEWSKMASTQPSSDRVIEAEPITTESPTTATSTKL